MSSASQGESHQRFLLLLARIVCSHMLRSCRGDDRSERVIIRILFPQRCRQVVACHPPSGVSENARIQSSVLGHMHMALYIWRVDRSVEYCCFGSGIHYRTVHPFWDERPRAKRRPHYLYPEPYKSYPCSPFLPEPNNQKPLSSHCTTFSSGLI